MIPTKIFTFLPICKWNEPHTMQTNCLAIRHSILSTNAEHGIDAIDPSQAQLSIQYKQLADGRQQQRVCIAQWLPSASWKTAVSFCWFSLLEGFVEHGCEQACLPQRVLVMAEQLRKERRPEQFHKLESLNPSIALVEPLRYMISSIYLLYILLLSSWWRKISQSKWIDG